MVEIFIVAGEASGDQIGADLMERLGGRDGVRFSGVGGDVMQAAGLQSLFPMEDLAVMGVVDVVARLPKLLYRLRQTGNRILKQQPDAVVLIDSQVFSRMLAQRLRRAGYKGPIVLYVAPTVWAHRPERARKLAALIDEVFAILPFEPELMANLAGPPTRFVGHPALGRKVPEAGTGTKRRLALLPGSRRGELRRHMPMYRQVVTRIARSHPELEFYLPTLPHIADEVARMLRDWEVPVDLVTDREKRSELGAETILALVASGTATLETALAGVPMVVTYVMDAAQRRAYRRLSIEHISLPNIILNQPLVPELLFDHPDAERLAASIEDLLDDEESRQAQLDGFRQMAAYMTTGTPEHPRCDPAERVLSLLDARRSDRQAV